MATIWKNLIHGNFKNVVSSEVSPLISSKWGQSLSNDNLDATAYNFYAPEIHNLTDACKALAGCPAVAAGQIFRYHKFPQCFAFDYSNMPDVLYTNMAYYNTKKREIANLLRNIADKMNVDENYFGCDASGATLSEIYMAIKNDFSYEEAVIVVRNNYNINDWKSILMNELNYGRPIIYLGTSSSYVSHAFICDGYKDMTFGKMFHYNFGWNGNSDGYYRVNNPNGFSINQMAIIFLQPNKCNSYREINWFDKFFNTITYYKPVYGTIYSSPSFVTVQNYEFVHYKAYNEIILENFETSDFSEFIAENIPCNSCNFVNY